MLLTQAYGSFVVPLTDPKQIQTARLKVSQKGYWDEDYVVGLRIVFEPDGINRNYYDPEFRLWSWQVTALRSYGGMDLVRLHPADVEWASTVDASARPAHLREFVSISDFGPVAELGPRPFFMNGVPTTNGITFHWTTPGAESNAVYTLVNSTTLNPESWKEVPGGAWPLATNRWFVAQPSGFYRVEALIGTKQMSAVPRPGE